MSNVTQITPHLRDVEAPAAIRDLPAWVIWRLEHHEGEPKPRKVPYYASGGKRAGQQGGPDDVAKLVTFDAAKRAAAKRGFDGVGIATLPQFGICALDFDNCITDGKIHPQVEALLVDTYAEFSPSGQGIRVLFKGDLGNRKDTDPSTFGYGMETFSTKGFVTFTGNTLEITELLGNDDTVAPLNAEAMALYHKRFAKVDRTAPAAPDTEPVWMDEGEIAALLDRLDPDMPHDQWLHVGMGLHHEAQGQEAGFQFWDEWSAKGSKYPGTEVLRQRWVSFGRYDGAPVTMRTVLKLAGISVNSPASPNEFESLVDTEPSADASTPPRYQFEPVHSFSSTQALPWIIKGVLPKAGLGVVYGASGSGKSFVVLDMGMAIARGAEWRGRKVKQGRVAYIAAEGADGFRKRLAAYAQHNAVDLTDVPMTVLNAAPNLLEKQDAVDVAKGIKASGGADLIIIDTFAQTTPGANENAGEDVGKALGYCKRIHESTGAMVLLIHHSGKDATKGARGWSGLRAACDAEIEVVREKTGRLLQLTKSKDGEDGLKWGFDLDVVQLGVDEDLDPITSCVVVEAEIPMAGVGPLKELGPVERVVNDVIQEIAISQTEGIEVGPVIAEAVRRMEPPKDGKRDTRKQRVRRALEKLTVGDDAPYWLGDDGCIAIC